MAKKFDIPEIYRSPIIKRIKESRQILDPRKKDVTPSVLDFGPVRFLIPRHFGFCYGVENAIDIAYRTIEQNPGRNIYLLSEMIHNPTVNNDLLNRGVKFLFETDGTPLIPIESLTEEDIVIVPAFGTTIEIQKRLEERGVNPYQYDTTCPFVEKVWNRGSQLGKKGHSLVIHGKDTHEETRATFSHSRQHSDVVVVFNPAEARILAEIMLEERPLSDFDQHFGHKCTPGFNPLVHLEKFGVINQTTMLATETREVMEILREAAVKKYGAADIADHFSDTSDTLCYATNENQSATYGLLDEAADLAIVVGGYNSSNTMHLVELLETKFPTYHVRDAKEIGSPGEIRHFNQWDKSMHVTHDWLPGTTPLTVAITSGASCPDALVDEVILKICGYFNETVPVDEAMAGF
jgi:4-hydroxy-3-methylbut-2-enyl diphosphate reductase